MTSGPPLPFGCACRSCNTILPEHRTVDSHDGTERRECPHCRMIQEVPNV